MRIMDEKFRLFGWVSVIDIGFVILLIVFVSAAMRFAAPRMVSAKPGDAVIHYTVELQKKDVNFKNRVVPGVEIYDSVKGYHIGKVINVRVESYLEDVPDFAGRIVRRAPVEGLETIYVDVEAEGQVTDQTTVVGQYEILVGKEIYVRTKDFASPGFVVALEGGN